MISKIIAFVTGLPLWAWVALGSASILAAGALWIGSLRHQVSEGQIERKALSEALRASEAEASNLRKIRSADQSAAATKQAENKAIDEKEAKQHDELDKALSGNPDWGSNPIPPAVLDSLH